MSQLVLNELQVLALRDHHSRVGMPHTVKSDPPQTRTLERRQMLRIVNAYALAFFENTSSVRNQGCLRSPPAPTPKWPSRPVRNLSH
jgi:hypothetical protein